MRLADFLKWLDAECVNKRENGYYIKFNTNWVDEFLEFETFPEIYIVERISPSEAIFTEEAWDNFVHNYEAPIWARER